MKKEVKKPEIEYDETNFPGKGGMMIAGKFSEKDRLAMLAIIEKNNAKKQKSQLSVVKG
ncbi:MAG: hypothetical protein V4722_11835 [Bacteroidota bacterium]